MELTIQYFFLIKLALLLILVLFVYKLVEGTYTNYLATKKVKFNKFWLIGTLVLLVFSVISPVKMDVATAKQTTYSNHLISQQKELPPRVTDNSFKQSVTSVEGITESDLPK